VNHFSIAPRSRELEKANSPPRNRSKKDKKGNLRLFDVNHQQKTLEKSVPSRLVAMGAFHMLPQICFFEGSMR
jgi:hypothetical protein